MDEAGALMADQRLSYSVGDARRQRGVLQNRRGWLAGELESVDAQIAYLSGVIEAEDAKRLRASYEDQPDFDPVAREAP